MSRIGNKIITLPEGVRVNVAEGNLVTVTGPKGTLTKKFYDKLTIEIRNGEASIGTESPISILDLLELTLQLQLQAMESFIEKIPEEDKEAVKSDLYDKYNEGASALLSVFAPEFELREDLTAEAILKAENEIIEAKYAAMMEEKNK